MVGPSPSSLDLSGVGVRPAGDRRAPLPGELDLSGIGAPVSPSMTPQAGPDGLAPAAPWAEDDAASARRASAFGMPAMDRDADTYMQPDAPSSAPPITQDAVDLAGNAALDTGWSSAARGMAAGAVLADGPDSTGAEQAAPQDDDVTLRRAAWLLDGNGNVRPEDAARAREVSRATGFPLQDALANLDSGERILARAGLERTLRDLKDTAPRTLGLLADAEAVLHAKDDVPALSGMERGLSAALAVRAGWDSTWTTLTKGIVRAPIVIERGMEQMVGQTGGAVASLAGMLPRNDNSDALLRFGDAMERMGLAASKRTGERLDSPALSAPAASRYTADQIWASPSLMLDPNWLAQNTTDAAAQLVPTMLAYLSGGGAAATVVGGWQEAAAFYEQLRDSGMDRDRAQAASMVFGAVVGKLEAFGVERMFAQSTAETMVGRALHRLSVGVSEAGSEYMENPIQGAIEGVARGESMPEILSRVEAGLKDISVIPPSLILGMFAPGATGALNREGDAHRRAREQVAGASGGGDDGGQAVDAPPALDATTRAALAQTGEAMSAVARDTAEAVARVQAGQQLAAAAQAADESRLRQRSPEAFAEIAARLVPEGAEQMWLDPATVETFMQSPRPQGDGGQAGEEARPAPAFGPAVLDVLGITPDALEQARATGAPLPVDTVRVLAAGQDVRAAVLDAARLTPDGMTDAEARAFNPQARLEEGVEKVRTAQRRAADVLKEERRLRKELVAAGYPKHVAQDAVTLAVSSANAFAEQYGWDAAAMLSRVSIQRGAAEQAQAAGQGVSFAQTTRSAPGVVGHVPQEVADRLPLQKSGEIRLDEEGMAHIRARHGAEIARVGYPDPEAFVRDVLGRVDAVYPGNSERTALLVARGRAQFGQVVIRLEFDPQGDFYRVKTAMPVRSDFFNEKSPLWERAQSNHPGKGTPGAVSGHNELQVQDSTGGGDVNGVETFDQTANGAPRAHVQFLEDGRAIIRVFDGADLSSVVHELGHVWFANLEQVQADGMAPALERFADRAQQIAETAEVIAAGGVPQQVVDLAARVGTAAQGDNPRPVLMALREELRAMAGRERQAATGTDDGGQAPPSTPAQVALRRMDSALSSLIAHARGMEQAAADVATLREWAGVPVDGPLTPEQRTHLHEQTARGTEAYLREGNAPTPALAGVFQRISTWLRKIYSSVRDLDVKLTDEVRDVFGRMLTTDAEVSQSREVQAALAGEDDFLRDLSVAVGGLDLDDAERLAELRSKAEATVTARMDAATLRDRAARRREHRKEATRIVNDKPLWQLVDYLASNDGPGLNRAYLAELYGEQAVRSLAKRRPGLVRENGTMLDDVAQEFGWADGDTAWAEMYDTMALRRETKTSQIRELADRMMAVEDAEHTPDEMLTAGEDFGDYLEDVDRVLTRLMVRERWARRRQPADAATLLRQADALRTPRARIVALAANEINATPLRDIRPDRYGAALRVALRERDEAVKRGNVAEAVNAHQRARIAAELLDMAHRTRRDAEQVQQQAQRMLAAKPEVRDGLHTEGIRRVAVNMGLVAPRAPLSRADAAMRLRDIVSSGVDAEGAVDATPSFPDWLLNEGGPDERRMPDERGRLNWKHLTPGELRDVANLLAYLDHMGRNLRGADKRSEQARIDAAAINGAQPMAGLKRLKVHERHSRMETVANKVRGAIAELASLQWQMRQADGHRNLGADGEIGPNEAAYQDVLDGENAVRVQQDQVMQSLMPAFIHFHQRMREWKGKYGRNMAIDGEPLAVPRVWADNGITHWTPENVLALALNMGSASNMARIRAGYPDLQYATVARIFGNRVADHLFSVDPHTGASLGEPVDIVKNPVTGEFVLTPMRQVRTEITAPVFTLRDWEMVQEIGDVLETLWPQTAATYKALYGYEPPKLPVTGMVLHESGRHVSLRGWYYPARYDPRLSDRVGGYTEQEDLLNRMDSMFRTPTANRSFTKQRADRAPGHPMRLDVDVLTSHITDSLRLIHLARPVRFLDRMTQHPAWKSEFTAVFGTEEMQALRDNLRYLLRDPMPQKGIGGAIEPFRPYIVQYALGWNFRTALLQLTALFPGMYDTGIRAVVQGVGKMVRSPKETMRAIHGLSPYMASRWNNIDQDLRKAARSLAKPPVVLGRLFGREVTWDHVLEANMLLIKVADTIASHSLWQGAFEKKLAAQGHMEVEEAVQIAVRHADRVVKAGNPDGDASSKARFLRADSSVRVLSIFSSAVVLNWQRQHAHNQALRHGAITLKKYGKFMLFQHLFPAVGIALISLLANGADDWEDVWKIFLDSQIDVSAGVVPVLGSTIMRGNVSTVLDTPLGMAKKGRRAVSAALDTDMAEAWWAAFAIASFVAQVPAEPVARKAARGWKQWQEGKGTPLSLLMPRPGK